MAVMDLVANLIVGATIMEPVTDFLDAAYVEKGATVVTASLFAHLVSTEITAAVYANVKMVLPVIPTQVNVIAPQVSQVMTVQPAVHQEHTAASVWKNVNVTRIHVERTLVNVFVHLVLKDHIVVWHVVQENTVLDVHKRVSATMEAVVTLQLVIAPVLQGGWDPPAKKKMCRHLLLILTIGTGLIFL